MNLRITALYDLLKLNTRLFHNCLEEIDEEAAQRRLNNRTNSLAFVAAHLVDARYCLARRTGADLDHPFPALADVEAIEDAKELPSLGEMWSSWDQVSAILGEKLAALTDGDLSSPASEDYPVEDRTLLGEITFLLQHEAYHIGQLAVLRKYLGYGPMRYS